MRISYSSSLHHQEFFTVHTAMVCHKYMTYTIAVCTVKNSWWCKEELYEICIFLFQK